MKRKSGKIFAAAVALAFGMTGCAENQIPDMTQEEIRAVGEYIAVTMMKYDRNHKSRLMELSADVIFPPEENPETSEPEEPSGMGPVDDTPVIDAAGDSTVAGTYSMEEVLGFPEGVTVEFREYKLCDYYPENSEDSYFTIPASEGNQLLALSFWVTNSSAEERNVDLQAMEPEFKITVNGEHTRKTLPITMLPNDMTVFSETLAAGESKEAVLLIEVGENMAKELSSIRLDVKNEEKTCMLTLL